jgi:hypothetical protein
MKHLRLISLCTFVLLSIGCKLIILKVEKIKQPAIENHASLSKFLLSYGIDTSEILCFRDTNALNAFYKSHIGAPDCRFFNREKAFVNYITAASDCNAKVSSFIEKIDTINQLKPVQGKMLDEYLQGVVYAKTGEKFALEAQDYDVYLVVYWVKYLGRVNKHKVFEWQNLVQKATQEGKKVRMMLVSADYQSTWGMSKKQLPKIKY